MTLDELEQNVRENPDDAWLADDMLALIARLRATEALVERAYKEGNTAYARDDNWLDMDWNNSGAKAALDALREGHSAVTDEQREWRYVRYDIDGNEYGSNDRQTWTQTGRGR